MDLIYFGKVATFHSGATEQVDTVGDTVEFVENDPCDARLDNELGAVETWRGGDVERGTVARIVGSRHFGDGICLGVEDIGFGETRLVLANVFKTGRSAVETVGDDGAIFHQESSHFAAHAIGILRPYPSHSQITFVEQSLLPGVIHFG